MKAAIIIDMLQKAIDDGHEDIDAIRIDGVYTELDHPKVVIKEDPFRISGALLDIQNG